MKKVISKIFLFVFLITCSFSGIAQLKKAEKQVQFFNYSKAIPFLLKSAESESSEIRNKSIQMLADCYRHTNNFGEAKDWYEKAIAIPGTDSINYFYLGQAYRALGMYENAANAFLTFQQAAPDSLDAQRYYQYSIKIQEWLELPLVAEVKNVETINTRFSDFGPAAYKNGIVFTSDRKKDQLDDTYGWTNFNYLNLHYTEPEYYRNFWSPMKPVAEMELQLNQNYHDGPATFTSDFNGVYITKTTNKQRNKDKDNIHTSLLKIYYADITSNKRPSFKEMPFNNANYSVAHPTLSEDDKRMIFSSDIPGGFGGSDLYISKLENGKWSSPKNMGPKVNTKGNEVFPYWANDTVLYFSSDDHMGYGGLDIYKSFLVNDSLIGAPENLKAPINTSYDDFGILLSDNPNEGLFSSNRPDGKGSDDIYAFRNLKKPEKPFMVNGYVKNAENAMPLFNATVFFFDTERSYITIAKTDSDGYFELPARYDHVYAVKAMKDSFVCDCLSFRTPTNASTKNFAAPRDLLLKKLKLDWIQQVEIFYNLDEFEIREDAKLKLDSLVVFMKNHPIKAELSSHTDCRAAETYNLNLSQKRADAAVQYMISKGIEADRIYAKGYGESKLVNHCADGVDCSEEEHQANRRTEFKIVEIDPSLFVDNRYNLQVFKAGDIVSPTLFDADFFKDCLLFNNSK